MPYSEWLHELADWLNEEPEAVEDAYPQLRALLYEAGMTPREAADCIRTGM